MALESADRTFGMKVILERGEHILRRRILFERTEPAAAERFGERSRTLPRARETFLVVIERAPVMDIEEV